jgi:hypothetical protein
VRTHYDARAVETPGQRRYVRLFLDSGDTGDTGVR